MTDILIDIAGFLFRLFFELLLTWTGEVVLFVITLGKHKPRWDLYTNDTPCRFVVFSEISLWIGAAFWVALVVLLCKVFWKT